MEIQMVVGLLVVIAQGIQANHVTCRRNYVKIGCYNDHSKPLPIQLITDRDNHSPHYEGHTIDWQNWWLYIHSLACRCAEKAKSHNYKVFGLQNFGECWSGPGAEKDYARDDKSTSCYPHPCDINKPQECVGMPDTNFIYRIEDDPCASNPCKNGGSCSTGPNGFYCRCPPNFEGTECENDVDECLSNPCKNNGACKNTHGGFECACPQGFKGKLCELSCDAPVVDLCILVDSSGSIGNNRFMAIKRFLLSLVDSLDVSETRTHVATINYSKQPIIHGRLDDPQLYHPIWLKLSMLKLQFLDEVTRTDLALKLADKEIFTLGGGDRSSAPDVMIVITDGVHSDESASIKDVVKPLKDRGVRIIAVGVDKSAARKELQEIALGNKDNVFIEDDIEKIPIHKLLKAIKSTC